MKLKKHQQAFIQNWGTYSNQTLVVVGMSHKEIVAVMKRMNLDKEAIKIFEESDKNKYENELVARASAYCWFEEQGRSVLSFSSWKNDPVHVQILAHEIYHLIFNILHKQKNMANDDEGCAYQTEFLFKELFKKLTRKETK